MNTENRNDTNTDAQATRVEATPEQIDAINAELQRIRSEANRVASGMPGAFARRVLTATEQRTPAASGLTMDDRGDWYEFTERASRFGEDQ